MLRVSVGLERGTDGVDEWRMGAGKWKESEVELGNRRGNDEEEPTPLAAECRKCWGMDMERAKDLEPAFMMEESGWLCTGRRFKMRFLFRLLAGFETASGSDGPEVVADTGSKEPTILPIVGLGAVCFTAGFFSLAPFKVIGFALPSDSSVSTT